MKKLVSKKIKLDGRKTFFTSDLHFFQKNILEGISQWDHADNLRKFDSVEEMNNTLVSNINDMVGQTDNLVFLGDLCFSRDYDDIHWILNEIKCLNIYFIRGNHDHFITKTDEFDHYFKVIADVLEIRIIFPGEGIDPDRDKWIGKQDLYLSHYAHRIWNKSHRDTWMLYGHSHASLDNIEKQEGLRFQINDYFNSCKTMDVGVDNVYRLTGEYRPLSFFEIKEIMDEKQVLVIDHHEKRL